MPYGMLKFDIVVTELHAYDFVIKKGRYLCWTLYFVLSHQFVSQNIDVKKN